MNIKVCERCTIESNWFDWGEKEVEFWKEGVFFCTHAMNKIYIQSGPPDCCPYKFEHIILEQDDE